MGVKMKKFGKTTDFERVCDFVDANKIVEKMKKFRKNTDFGAISIC
jgi:hypothetical protein